MVKCECGAPRCERDGCQDKPTPLMGEAETLRKNAVAYRRWVQERCPLCLHEWSRHDPEDGECDAHTDEPGEFGACKCGRDLGWMQTRIAALSSAALSEGEG